MNHLAVFDCDGTLVDSQAAICRAMDECFASHGLTPPDRQATRRIVGLSLPQAMRALLPDAEPHLHDLLAQTYKSAFHRHRAEGLVEEPLFDGIADAVQALEDAGWLLGVATGKSDRGLRLCLERHGLHARFVTLQTADRHPSKPHPAMLHAAMAGAGAAPETTVMIGDTSFDMMMAREAGAHALGVGWGYHDADDLRSAGALDVVETAQDLIGWMERF
ncbi:HAD-IA family hydrolase [Sphingomonas sp. MAH-20]|uniref:HAD-IA family hydrolase n=1 Tax=Sphingomonas horti TaxID=2682842 RepID=A0A6I4IXR3_9SPHN|nr:HAD-IA family hydrolase [Sphingomonas sp. CGMCC 1.13658]MBA2921038.1 HAD-IA family hydrolase [Sphingomonas sp. CGMCC 1.13658]MVO76982.1 HAD-IA family hydrolase [Sphingomonas horti]